MLKKRKYLYRLAVSIFGILLAPAILFIVFFWRQSYKELIDSNDKYYEELIESYKNVLDRTITNLKAHATNIVVQSKKSDNPFWKRPMDEPYENYWYYNAMIEMNNEYTNHGASSMGIYYYDTDVVLRGSGVMGAEQYIRLLKLEDEEAMRAFFSSDNYHSYETEFLISSSDTFFVGFFTTLGFSHEKALIFYQVSRADLESELGTAYKGSGFECFMTVPENETAVLYIGDNTEIPAEKVYTSESGLEFYTLCGYLTEDAPQNRATVFFAEMGVWLFFTIVVMLLSYVIIIYIAYKPVYNITSQFENEEENDEFEIIDRVIKDKNIRISEQEMMILDFLLNHLLYGIPISENRLKHLGITDKIKYYCVFLLDGYVLNNTQERELALLAEKEKHAKMFVADWQGKQQSVFIIFMEEKNTEELKELLYAMCDANQIARDALYGGKVVNRLDNISASLQQCLKELKAKSGDAGDDSSRAQKQEKQKQEILEYVEHHYRDAGLGQEWLADYFKISTYTLSRIFRNQIGVGFVEYVNAKRVEFAKEQLLTTSLSVHDIAMQSGFSSDNNFFKVFKAYTGASPTAFRSGRE